MGIAVGKPVGSGMIQSGTKILALALVPVLIGCSGFKDSDQSTSASTGGDTASASDAFAKAKSILDRNCVSCHKVGGLAGQARLDWATEAEFMVGGLVVPGDPANSLLIKRSIYSGVTGLDNMPMGSGGSFTEEDHLALVQWVNGMVASNNQAIAQFTCNDPGDVGISNIVRLTKVQFLNTLTDLFGASVVSSASTALSILPSDDVKLGATDAYAITTDKIEAYMDVAVAVAGAITSSDTLTKNVFGSCATGIAPAASCIDTYLSGFAVKILRRPLSTGEITAARATVNSGGDYRANLKLLLATHLQSPYFILRTELGTANDDSKLFALTPFEVAARVAYETTDSGPDDQLIAAARANALNTTSAVETQVRRLFSTARGKTKIRQMFRSWLQQLAGVDTSSLPAELTSGVDTSGLDQAIMAETDAFIDYIVWERNGGYRELLTSRASLASHTGLALIYGHAPISASRAVGGPTGTFAGRREGLLMRVSYLAGAKTRTSLVSRGVRLRRQVLCEELPDPTPQAVMERESLEPTEAERLTLTNRQYITRMTSGPTCISCHGRINPTGFAFENFDSLGRFRDQELIFDSAPKVVNRLPVDTVTSVLTWSGKSVSANDSYDLINNIASSSEGPACLARQAYRYFSQRREGDQDSCHLGAMFDHLTKANASILDAFVAAVANNVSGVRRRSL